MVDQMMILEQSGEKTPKKKHEQDGNPIEHKRASKSKRSKPHPPINKQTIENSSMRTITKFRSIFKDIPVQELTKDSLTRKSVSIDGQVYKTIKRMKSTMSQKSHGRFTFNMVIQSLLQDHVDLQNLRSELLVIKKEMEETQNYLKEMLKLALINSKPQVQYIPISGQPLTTPPPLSPSRNPPKKIEYIPPNTGNLMRDYVKEIKQLFKGEILRPSDVAEITKIKTNPVKELAEDRIIPDIELISVAKHFKPIVEEELDA
ncbi:MAG: hypothetical protein JW776_11420 [Candidatus Lokiarchaeota archaeon]|nr:hypothetical protein [Candidatus Lokiarchaeota archaeon]